MMKMFELLKLPLDVSYEHFAVWSRTKCDCYTISFSAVLYHLLYQGYQHLEAEHLGLKLQTHRLFLTPHSWNHTIATK
jgi:hypothetical protein